MFLDETTYDKGVSAPQTEVQIQSHSSQNADRAFMELDTKSKPSVEEERLQNSQDASERNRERALSLGDTGLLVELGLLINAGCRHPWTRADVWEVDPLLSGRGCVWLCWSMPKASQ